MRVFEAMNHGLKEILVGMTSFPLPELLGARCPAEVAHWAAGDGLSIRSVAGDMPVADARRFVELYVFFIERGGWRILRQAELPEERL